MYPEVDYELPKTVALVKRELRAMGIPYTEKYGKGSVVGYINPDKTNFYDMTIDDFIMVNYEPIKP